MVKVRFTKSFKMYNPGEVAGFPESEAAVLVAIGAAEVIEEPKAEVAPEPVKPAKRKPGRPKKIRKPTTEFVVKG